MADEIDVDLVQVLTDGPHRVGAERVLVVLRQLAPTGVPILATWKVLERVGGVGAGNRQDDLDPLGQAGIAEQVEVRTGERHSLKVWAQPGHRAHADVEGSESGHGLCGGEGHRCSCVVLVTPLNVRETPSLCKAYLTAK